MTTSVDSSSVVTVLPESTNVPAFVPRNDPVTAMIGVGFFGAANTAIGASIRHHNIHNEALLALTGGLITGFFAGSLASLLQRKQSDPLNVKLRVTCIDVLLNFAAGSFAPILGQAMLKYDDFHWCRIILDQLIGAATFSAALFVLLVCIIPCIIRCFVSRQKAGNENNFEQSEVGTHYSPMV